MFVSLFLFLSRYNRSCNFIYYYGYMDVLPFMPYNTSLRDYARENRFQPNLTKSEALFWNIVLKHDKTWYRFLRQKIINFFILDFYCSKLRLGIEIDGWYHQEQEAYDSYRTDVISEYGIKIIRYTNEDILYGLDWVILDLKEQIQIREQEIF